jgi:hypothetical protein
MFDEEVLAFEDVAARTGDVQELRSRLQAVLLPADVAVRTVIVRRWSTLGDSSLAWAVSG